jgi:hypothetical protein
MPVTTEIRAAKSYIHTLWQYLKYHPIYDYLSRRLDGMDVSKKVQAVDDNIVLNQALGTYIGMHVEPFVQRGDTKLGRARGGAQLAIAHAKDDL